MKNRLRRLWARITGKKMYKADIYINGEKVGTCNRIDIDINSFGLGEEAKPFCSYFEEEFTYKIFDDE